MSTAGLGAEVARLRDRVHDLSATDTAIVLRVAALESWREDHQRDADRIYSRVDELASDAVTSRAVALALRGRQRVELSWFQRAAGLVIFVVSVTDFAMRLRGR